MDSNQYLEQLTRLIADFGKETRFLEFKSNYQDVDRLGKYISALSNGATLENRDYGYLYFGVDDGTLELKGTTFDASRIKAKGNQDLELYLRKFVVPRVNFRIEEFSDNDGKRFVVFCIPAAKGEPTCYMGIPYVRVDSSVTDMRPYADWMRTIYNSEKDWTAEVVPNSTIDDLDKKAVEKALEGFCERYPDRAEEAKRWDLATFLDKAKLTIGGEVTRTTLLLVGKEESAHLLGHIAQMVWRLRTETENAGEIFTIPFLLSTTKLKDKIRNYRIKIFPKNELIPAEVWKYDNKTILEALHNCIAHQDYKCSERIVVTEESECLSFENAGSFFDGSFEDYIEGDKTPRKYRNPFLVQAMVNLRMIDTQGYGIHEMFLRQKERYLPLPDYDKQYSDRVRLIVPGQVIDEEYSLLLMEDANIDLTTAVLLDKVQKRKQISDDAIAKLRKLKLIEGRKPNLYISKNVAKVSHREAEYTKMKGMDDKYYRDMIMEALKLKNELEREDFKKLLLKKLPEIMTDKQKENKITNLLRYLRARGMIYADKQNKWHLTENK